MHQSKGDAERRLNELFYVIFVKSIDVIVSVMVALAFGAALYNLRLRPVPARYCSSPVDTSGVHDILANRFGCRIYLIYDTSTTFEPAFGSTDTMLERLDLQMS